jgi:hypothetical protein
MMNQLIIFAVLALVAVLVVYIILRIIVGIFSSIPKWIYVLVILSAIFGAAFLAFGTTVFNAMF